MSEMISLGLEFQLEESHCRVLPQIPEAVGVSSLSFAQFRFFFSFCFFFAPYFTCPILCFSHKLLILKNGASIILKNRESINGKEKKEINLFIEKLSGESRLSVVGRFVCFYKRHYFLMISGLCS